MKTKRFVKETEIEAPVEKVFDFHRRPGAIASLIPPWTRAELIGASGGLEVGAQTRLRIRIGPLKILWIAEHTEFKPNRLFCDVQRQGPFAYWHHRHIFEPTAGETTLMRDEVDYALPLGWAGELLGGWLVRRQLRRMFDYRHRVVAEKIAGTR